MWKIILCQLGFCNDLVTEDSSDVLYEKTRLLLYRANSLTHFNIVKEMLKQYETDMRSKGCPLYMVEKYNELVILWNQRFKLWKRG